MTLADPLHSLLGLAAIGAVFAVLFVLERVAPLRDRRRPGARRLLVNLGVAGSAAVVAAGLIVPTATAVLDLTQARGIGLLHWLDLPVWLEAAVGFLLLDLAYYWWHRANHLVPFLWRFHVAHHVDPDLDVTTATRFHFGEMFFSVGFQAAQISILGVSTLAYVVYAFVFEIATLFHHSNWRLPARLERLLDALFVTPRMHGIHHSQAHRETNQNFSVVFSLWDRLHRTLLLDSPQPPRVGVPGYDRPEDNGLGTVLANPFRRQRDYWPGQDHTS